MPLDTVTETKMGDHGRLRLLAAWFDLVDAQVGHKQRHVTGFLRDLADRVEKASTSGVWEEEPPDA